MSATIHRVEITFSFFVREGVSDGKISSTRASAESGSIPLIILIPAPKMVLLIPDPINAKEGGSGREN